MFVMADFPVPVGPTKSRGISWVIYVSRKNRCRHVSTVGMIRSLTWGKGEGRRERERKERRKERGKDTECIHASHSIYYCIWGHW